MRKQPTPEERAKILEHFLAGNGVNHIQFLMGSTSGGGYRFDPDDVNDVIRQALKRALGAHKTVAEQVQDAVEHPIPWLSNELLGKCAMHGEFRADVPDSPCPSCEDGYGSGNGPEALKRSDTMSTTIRKGNFTETVQTQEAARTVDISFSDELEKIPPVQIDPPAQERLLLRVCDASNPGKNVCVYLGRDQLNNLIHKLEQARDIWFAEF